MKKIYFVVMICLFLTVAGLASADQVSFIWDPSVGETLQGVDGDTSGWSNSDASLSLGENSWSLLGGYGVVKAWDSDIPSNPGILTHRGTRGLGILGGEDDEIDNPLCGGSERLVIKFNAPTELNSFQVRSLFYDDKIFCWPIEREKGAVKFFYEGENFFTQTLLAQEYIGDGGNGIVDYVYDTPYLIDKIVFYVPEGIPSIWSDFSVAKLDVTAVPEPVSTVLFLLGGATLAVRRLRRKTK
ncbi:MAG: PEP-CTERM sorting domain-containing protein [Candidatus Omnitrophica bacterium]|nr:PEP-CTERM sorting domain-containing protein [Candidatus Omnitrophota bacterium]